MAKDRFSVFSFLLLWALFLALPSQLFSLEGEPGNPENSGNALNRLIEISDQLSQLNERLRNELQDSRQNSRELQTMLEASRRELDGLRQELGPLKQELQVLQSASTALLNKAENSLLESTELLTALKKAESSLMSLEHSFALYQQTAERKILSLEKQSKFWKWGCVAAGVLAAGFCAALVMSP
jgi:chromosome segregation ATPase